MGRESRLTGASKLASKLAYLRRQTQHLSASQLDAFAQHQPRLKPVVAALRPSATMLRYPDAATS